jgi:transporter family protein
MLTLPASWILWALLSALFAALTAVFAKLGVQSWASEPALFVRTLVVIGVLLGLMIWKQNWPDWRSLTGRDGIFLLLSGLATGLSWLCYFYALQQGPVALVAPLDKLSVVFIAIFAIFGLGESLNPGQWAGVGLIAVGAVLVAACA